MISLPAISQAAARGVFRADQLADRLQLGHWSGHPTRLTRDLSGHFGSALYAKEELVAKTTNAFVCASLGIVSTVCHADYIGSWFEVLREDNRAIDAPPVPLHRRRTPRRDACQAVCTSCAEMLASTLSP